MHARTRNAVLAIAILAFGAARLPFEASLSRELRAMDLTPIPIEIGTRDKIGQTSSAVVLGGLRTLVATFMNLRAFGYFEESNWAKVSDTYETIVDLAPRSEYYWDNGSWYTAYCAASYYLNNKDLPALRRRQAWRDSILSGRAFLERGIKNNPGDWSLLAALGNMLSSEFKFPAFGDPDKTFAEAADAYHRAVATGNALGFVPRAEALALARVAGKEREALELIRTLYENPRNRVPTLSVMLIVLESFQDPDMDTSARAIEIFGTPEKAYDALKAHWLRGRDRFPVYGVAKALEVLEKTLSVPPEKSIFRQPVPPPRGPDEWFAE